MWVVHCKYAHGTHSGITVSIKALFHTLAVLRCALFGPANFGIGATIKMTETIDQQG